MTRQQLYPIGILDFRKWLDARQASPATVHVYTARISSIMKYLDTDTASEDFLRKITDAKAVQETFEPLAPSTRSAAQTAWRAYCEFASETANVHLPELGPSGRGRLARPMVAPPLVEHNLPPPVVSAINAIFQAAPDLETVLFGSLQWGHLLTVTPALVELVDPRQPRGRTWSWRDGMAWPTLAAWARAQGSPLPMQPLVPVEPGGMASVPLTVLHHIRKAGERGDVPLLLPPPQGSPVLGSAPLPALPAPSGGAPPPLPATLRIPEGYVPPTPRDDGEDDW